MVVLRANNISVEFGDNKVLDDVGFFVEKGDKTAIVGVNGAGKSTLINVLRGSVKPTQGDVFISSGLRVGFLEQENLISDFLTIYDAVLESFGELIDLEKRLRVLEDEISHLEDETIRGKKISLYDRLSTEFNQNGGFEYISRAKGILRGLGFLDEEFKSKVGDLSSGQKTRLFMARLLSRDIDILFLDEPTNHLDINALTWLESFLQNYNKTVVLVSHDRYFIDKVCNKVIELEYGKARSFSGNFSAYLEKKDEDKQNQMRLFENQQKEIKRMEDIVKQQRQWNRQRNIIAAESRLKAIDRIDKIEAPSKDPFKIRLELEQEFKSGNDCLEVDSLEVGFGENLILKDFNVFVNRGEKVFILGPNGCGKSTLLKAILSKIDINKGQIRFGTNVKISYYDQEMTSLDFEKNMYEELLAMEEDFSQTILRNTLASLGFKGDDAFKKIGVLSGGEKARVLLAKTLLKRANFIFLDEPTNHLDIASRRILEDAISGFDGTCFCVSHDRYFVKRLATRILFFEDGLVLDYKGDYESFLEWKKLRDEKRTDSKDEKNNKDTSAKRSFLEAKEIKTKERKLQKKITQAKKRALQIEELLEEKEGKIKLKNQEGDYLALEDLINEKNDLEDELLKVYEFLDEL